MAPKCSEDSLHLRGHLIKVITALEQRSMPRPITTTTTNQRLLRCFKPRQTSTNSKAKTTQWGGKKQLIKAEAEGPAAVECLEKLPQARWKTRLAHIWEQLGVILDQG